MLVTAYTILVHSTSTFYYKDFTALVSASKIIQIIDQLLVTQDYDNN